MEEKKQLTIFKVRDLRQKTQFKIDDIYINGYARFCKPVATAIYNSLCRHAEFNSQKAFPSQSLIAYQHSIPIRSVRRGIKKLVEYNIIAISKERKNGKFANYVYTLLDKSEWKSLPIGQKQPMVPPKDDFTILQKTTIVKQPTNDNKDYKDNKDINDNKDIIIAEQSSAGSQVNLLIDKFKSVNPSYERLFTNKTQRAALERLVKKFGKEKVENMIAYLPKTNQEQFAPVIITPLQLEQKLGQLIVFLQKEKSKVDDRKIVKI